MMKKLFALFLLTAGVIGGTASGQGCGANYAGGCGGGTTNCGREISQGEAAGLWENYCHETCFDYWAKRRCGLTDTCGSGGCFGYGNCGQSCGTGCATGGCATGGCAMGGCGIGNANGGGFLSKFRGHSDSGCDTCDTQGGRTPIFGGKFRDGGCGCESGNSGDGRKLFNFPNTFNETGCSGGCKLGFGQHFGNRFVSHANCGCGHRHGNMFRFLTGANAPGLFSCSAANCGANGGYFDEPIGYEYGNGGISSAVAGCGTNADPNCGCN